MGGGATMRAVNKVVGIGIVNSGFRSKLPENPVSAAVHVLRRPSSPISTTSKADPVKPAVVVEPIDETSLQKTVSGFDDWDFADVDGEDVIGLPKHDGKVSPRTVFGGVPSLDEAKEATSELKEVLEKACLSTPVSPRFGSRLSSPVSPRFGSCLSSPVSPRFGVQNPEAQPWGSVLTTDVAVPTHAVQAFRLINESPEIQDVVASIASDPNVWNSVLNNSQLQHFLRSQNIALSAENMNPYSHTDESSVNHDTDDEEEYNLEDDILHYWKSTKAAMVDMMDNLSVFFSTLFEGVLYTGKDSAETSFLEKALGPSLMGLVIMVIMVVFMKRPA